MRTTVIPAQITTVEDRIAANLNLTQIVLLLASLFIATFIYATFPPKLGFSIYKIPLFIAVFLVFGILALRIKGRVVLSWFFILSAYYLRPKYYVYNKNDLTTRNIGFLPSHTKQKTAHTAVRKESNARSQKLSIADLIRMEAILANPKMSFSFRFNKKGA
jgi:hypothetical protein